MTLQPQDRVAIIGTAGSLKDPRLIDAGLAILKDWGLEVEVFPSATAKQGYFAGNDRTRQRDLQQALDRQDIKAIFCARGGYGTTRILDDIDFRGFSAFPKWVVGFSDITALHLKIHQLGHCSLHAPTLNSFRTGTPQEQKALAQLKACLFGKPQPLHSHEPQTRPGEAIAPIVGGNLCILSHTIGSLTEATLQGKILFLEEVGEHPYQVDRNLTQLHRAGLLQDIVGLVIGNMDLNPEDINEFGLPLLEMLENKVPQNIPIGTGFPFGHIPANYPIISGSMAHLSVKEKQATLTFVGNKS